MGKKLASHIAPVRDKVSKSSNTFLFSSSPSSDKYLFTTSANLEGNTSLCVLGWKISSILDLPSGEEGRTLLHEWSHWQKMLATALSCSLSQRSLVVQYHRGEGDYTWNGHPPMLEIYLLAMVQGPTEEKALEEGRQYQKDLQSLLSLGEKFYLCDPLSRIKLGSLLSQPWTNHCEIKAPQWKVKVESKKTIAGFVPCHNQKPSHDEMSLARPWEIASPPTSLSQVLFHLSQPVSLQVYLTSTPLGKEEENDLETVLSSAPLIRPGMTQHVEDLMSEPVITCRLLLSSLHPLSPMNALLVGKTILGNELKADEIVDLSPEQLEKICLSTESSRLSHLHLLSQVPSMICLPQLGSTVPTVEEHKKSALYLPHLRPQQGLRLGSKSLSTRREAIYLEEKALAQHLYLLGQTGTGKSTLMKSMILELAERGRGVGLIDPHGDLVREVYDALPLREKARVVIFDPSHPKFAHPINPLAFNPHRPQEKTMVVDGLMDTFDTLYDLSRTGGPMFEMYMRNALLLAMSKPAGASIIDVPLILTDKIVRNRYLRQYCDDDLVKNFWQKEAEKADGDFHLANMAPYVTSKLNSFIYNHYLRPLVSPLAKNERPMDIRQMMDEGTIFLASLSKGLVGSRNANLLGLFMIQKFFLAALSRQEVAPSHRRPFSLFIDEFQNFTTNDVAHIFAEARKYGLSLVCSNQNLGQLKPQVADAALGTVGNIITFRPGVKDVDAIGDWFSPQFDRKDLLNLPNYQVAARLLFEDRPSRPFSFATELV